MPPHQRSQRRLVVGIVVQPSGRQRNSTGGVSVSCSPGPTLAYGRQSICTVAPLVAPALALIIWPTVVGMGGGSVWPTSRTYPVGSTAAQTFTFTAATPSGSLALHFPLSGAEIGRASCRERVL